MVLEILLQRQRQLQRPPFRRRQQQQQKQTGFLLKTATGPPRHRRRKRQDNVVFVSRAVISSIIALTTTIIMISHHRQLLRRGRSLAAGRRRTVINAVSGLVHDSCSGRGSRHCCSLHADHHSRIRFSSNNNYDLRHGRPHLGGTAAFHSGACRSGSRRHSVSPVPRTNPEATATRATTTSHGTNNHLNDDSTTHPSRTTSCSTQSATTIVDIDDDSSFSPMIAFPENIPLRKWIDITVPEGRVIGIAPLRSRAWLLSLSSISEESQSQQQDIQHLKEEDFFDESILHSSDPNSVTDYNVNNNPNHWIHSVFHHDEVVFGMALKKTRTSFWLGRLALRCLLISNLNSNNLDHPDQTRCKKYCDYPPILKDSYGRPDLSSMSSSASSPSPDKDSTTRETVKNFGHAKFFGSISHKKDRGVAILAKRHDGDSSRQGYIDEERDDLDSIQEAKSSRELRLVGVGVDLELVSRPGKASIAKRVLTPREQSQLGRLGGVSEEEEVLLRFSLKEAIYKAVHPVLCQYISFQEAEVTPYDDGTASCTWLLGENNSVVIDDKTSKLTAHWIRLVSNDGGDDYFLTSASFSMKGSDK